MKVNNFLLLAFANISFAIDCSFIPDYEMIHNGKKFDLATYGALIGDQNFTRSQFGNLSYNEEAIGAYFNYYLTEKNALTFGAGYTRQYLGWSENPAFHQKNFDDFVFDISLTSFQLDSWRWIIDLGAHLNLNHFNPIKSAFYTQLLWGRYQHLENLGIHIGFAGQAGIGKAKYLPLIGIDWYFLPRLSAVLVYPAEAALNYHVSNTWKLSLKYRSFAGWYHSYHRTGPDEPLPESIFTMESTGVDFGTYFDKENYRIYLYGGYNLGGWILIENKNGDHGKYYHFNGSPYIAFKAGITF